MTTIHIEQYWPWVGFIAARAASGRAGAGTPRRPDRR
jgi:hypothetical protein